ncbi:YfaZ family outer membrane protein [Lentisalinibacter orientalis]|uniref:YfaZ family outer membrane protein n=1 Tax=Lentisalinibacter orientalis TaxID=2992241 RepID=UPI0038642DEE
MLSMLKRAPLVLALLLLMAAPSAGAADLDINVNDDAARLTYAWQVPERKLQFDAGWLHHQDRGDVGHLGLHLVDLASGGRNPVRGGLGGKLFYTNADRLDESGFVVGLGGFLAYTLPTYNRFSVSGHLYFAPDVLAFSGADGYQEFEARLSYNVLREADIYLGARYSKADFDDRGDALIDNGLHVGIQLRF